MKKEFNSLRSAKNLQFFERQIKAGSKRRQKKPTDSIKDLAVLHRKTKRIVKQR